MLVKGAPGRTLEYPLWVCWRKLDNRKWLHCTCIFCSCAVAGNTAVILANTGTLLSRRLVFTQEARVSLWFTTVDTWLWCRLLTVYFILHLNLVELLRRLCLSRYMWRKRWYRHNTASFNTTLWTVAKWTYKTSKIHSYIASSGHLFGFYCQYFAKRNELLKGPHQVDIIALISLSKIGVFKVDDLRVITKQTYGANEITIFRRG